MKDLTERQQQILDFIKEYVDNFNYPPTYREICKHFNISSTNGVKRHVDALQKKGYLDLLKNASRTLSIKRNELKANENLLDIPIVGRVAAGYPILSEENVESTISVDTSFIRANDKCFALKVKGDSMIKAGILENDYVIINQQNTANNGDIVVALVNDEATLKRYYKNNGNVMLIPENDNFLPITVNFSDKFTIIGKVIGVMRFYR